MLAQMLIAAVWESPQVGTYLHDWMSGRKYGVVSPYTWIVHGNKEEPIGTIDIHQDKSKSQNNYAVTEAR